MTTTDYEEMKGQNAGRKTRPGESSLVVLVFVVVGEDGVLITISLFKEKQR